MFSSPLPDGVNVIGMITGNGGLAVHARHTVQALLNRGMPVSCFDVTPPTDEGARDLTYQEYVVTAIDDLQHPITILLLHPKALFSFLATNWTWYNAYRGLLAAIPMWELAVIPGPWLKALGAMDVLLCASHFVRGTYSTSVAGVLTMDCPCPLYLPSDVRPDRARFGASESETVFVTSFEPASDVVRKNPSATIAAFRSAFPGREAVRLLIKINNPLGQISQASLAAIRAQTADDSRITLIAEVMSYTDTLSLYASSDAFISLHRSEGLGLALMEAMSLGKPVIATAWSGNMSYMDYTNACPVAYGLVPVDGSLSVYRRQFVGPSARWADPHIDDAAAWMKLLAGDPALSHQIGDRAREAIRAYNLYAQRSGFLDELVTLAQHRARIPAGRAPSKLGAEEFWRASRADRVTRSRRTAEKFVRAYRRHIAWRLPG
jgi:glycosyltransferase involved in cell wall biosynthesis